MITKIQEQKLRKIQRQIRNMIAGKKTKTWFVMVRDGFLVYRQK